MRRGMPSKAQLVHGKERDIEADEEEPELPRPSLSPSMRPVTLGNQ
jgi:hypothetical protein